VQGAAHFLEHMLFLGSANFREGDLDSYLESFGGGTDAVTENETITATAGTRCGGLGGALERLIDAFVAPRLSREALQREVRVTLQWRTCKVLGVCFCRLLGCDTGVRDDHGDGGRAVQRSGMAGSSGC
jgi:nardilysin